MGDTDEKSEGRVDHARAKRQLAICFVLLGLCVGLFAGLSESPITATMIPLLFALLTGGAGLSLAKADLAKASDRNRLGLAATAISLFAGACLVSATYGIAVRSGSGLASFIPDFRVTESSPVAVPSQLTGSLDAVATALMLRRRLELLGANDAEIGVALDRFAELHQRRIHGQGLRGALLEIRATVADTYQRAILATSELKEKKRWSPDVVIEIGLALQSVEIKLDQFIKVVDAGGDVTSDALDLVAGGYNDAVQDLATSPDGRTEVGKLLQGSSISVAELVAVYEQIRTLGASLKYADNIRDLFQHIDEVVELGMKQGEQVRIPTLTTRRPAMKR